MSSQLLGFKKDLIECNLVVIERLLMENTMNGLIIKRRFDAMPLLSAEVVFWA
ncbi:MAG: hypothetical protein HW406_66 [Candidatus Brocadiaceae bacterium]|nr:hypothetical protein [Candidatus Brocadiaceae bacterium]